MWPFSHSKGKSDELALKLYYSFDHYSFYIFLTIDNILFIILSYD